MNSQQSCASRSYQNDQLVTCQLEPHANGVHLARVDVDGGTQELVQWNDSEAVADDEPATELPLWYGVLPLGESVRVVYRDEIETLHGELRGVVLDDHEQPAALVVDGTDRRRRLVAWHAVALVSWEHGDE